VGEPDDDGCRTVYFALNGHNRSVLVRDRSLAAKVEARRQADRSNPNHVAASMPGTVIALHVKPGARVEAGAPIVTLEAMKMETVVRAPRAGTVAEVVPSLKGAVQGGDLLAVLQ
jgi:pyruvate carboxylase